MTVEKQAVAPAEVAEMTGKKESGIRSKDNKSFKRELIIVILIAIFIVIIIAINGVINFGSGNGTMIGNPDYEDSLYIAKGDFLTDFNKGISGNSYNQYEAENKRELVLEFSKDMVINIGLQKNEKTLSYIIFSFEKEKQKNDVISIVSALYRIFDSDITEEMLGNYLIELGLSDGEIDYETYIPFMPDNHVSFSKEEKDGIMKLYINDAAMGY